VDLKVPWLNTALCGLCRAMTSSPDPPTTDTIMGQINPIRPQSPLLPGLFGGGLGGTLRSIHIPRQAGGELRAKSSSGAKPAEAPWGNVISSGCMVRWLDVRRAPALGTLLTPPTCLPVPCPPLLQPHPTMGTSFPPPRAAARSPQRVVRIEPNLPGAGGIVNGVGTAVT
jgi:hypothetical protein